MKKLFMLGLIFCATTHTTFASTVTNVDTIQNTECLDSMEKTLAIVSHPGFLISTINPLLAAGVYIASREAREAILSNLEAYERLIKVISNNIAQNISNQDNYTIIKRSLKAHENETVLGVEVGKAVVSCVRPLLSFRGSPAEQYALAQAAQSRIVSIRNAVQ